jgi:hydroxyacylglutathione hydrolase
MLDIVPLKAFRDNYIWALRGGGDAVVVVDPGEPDPVLRYLQESAGILDAILVTHKHADHVGGIGKLLEAWPDARVYGPAGEPIPAVQYPLTEGDRVDLPVLGAGFTVMEVPGHTEGHIAYYGEGALFCGDTLFAAGCGRVFSGTHAQLHDSLQRISALPPETGIYCAHEYTLDNLGFAAWVEPDNQARIERQRECERLRGLGLPTVPSTLALELQTNPFLRAGEAKVIAAAEHYQGKRLDSAEAVFTTIRGWKDREYD